MRTGRVYVDSITRYVNHFDKRRSRVLTATHVERQLNYLVAGRVVASPIDGDGLALATPGCSQ